MRVLSTLTRPDSGSARVAGIDVLADPVGVRRAIGVVGQKHGADPEATGRENLVLQGEFYGITGRELRARVAQSLERFGLADAADRQAKTYSGGMQRRLDIAMGLLHRPQVLFLDEPTTGLDPEARAEMWHEIERLAARGADDDPAHHPLPGGGRPARLAPGDRRSRPRRRRGHARRAQERAEGDAIQVELADPEDAAARAALERVAGIDEIQLDGATLRARARDGGAAIPAVLAALDAHGVQGRVGHARAAIARRCLPAPRRPRLHQAEREHEEVAA